MSAFEKLHRSIGTSTEGLFWAVLVSDHSALNKICRDRSNGGEAASLEKITQCIGTHPEGLMILEIDGLIVGFINSGCGCNVEMSDEDPPSKMTDPGGEFGKCVRG